MEIATIKIPYKSRAAIFRLWFVGDVHLGSALCDEEKLRATIADIGKDENARVILMGDLCEYISVKDFRWDDLTIAEWVDRADVGNSQMDRAVELFDPIRGKILGAIRGNHELVLERDWNVAVHNRLCNDLQIRNLGYSAMIQLRFDWRRGTNHGDRRPLVIFLHHGFGGGRTAGADINRFSDVMRDFDADLYVMGHTHQRYAAKWMQHYVARQTDELMTRVKLAGRSGTFLKSVVRGKTGYSERAAMRPVETGALCITYSPDKRDLVANV